MTKTIPLLSSFEQAWEEIEKQLNYKIAEPQKLALSSFYTLLLEANAKMNLTKLDSLNDFLTFHLFDTACILSCLDLEKPINKYLDLGSGCGVPGIVLHILLSQIYPQLKTTLCDSRKRRAQYLTDTVLKLNLQNNISIVNERAEVMRKNKAYTGQFCLITARALAKPIQTKDIVYPFKHKQGIFIYQTSTSLANDGEYLRVLNKKINIENHFILAEKNRYYGSW